jgi:adenosine deaminase
MFNTNLTNEYMLLASQFHFTRTQLAQLSLNGVRAAFLPEEEKKLLDAQFQNEIDSLLHSHSLA